MTSDKPFSGRIALVTGASRGIGYAASIALGKSGAHVVLVARTVGGLEEADDEIRSGGGSATLVPLDLRDGDAIDRLGASLFERFGRLDAFLGNAGVLGALTPITHLTAKTWDELIAVNLTANWRLIRSLDPLLRQSDAGRALFVTSGNARMSEPFWGGYGLTKAALESLVLTYAAECAGTKVKANLFSPGTVGTAMFAKAFPGVDLASLPAPAECAPTILSLLSPSCTANGKIFGRGA